jgi:hypothetical protein
MVYIKIKSWKIEYPSRKLIYIIVGPYKVLEKKRYLYLIDFLPYIKVYPIILLERIYKAVANPLLG